MKTLNGTTKLSMVALAVASLLSATAARADDAEAEAMKKPTNTVELGVYNVNGSSAKFGEYTGINKSGASVIGNVNIRGGDAYDQQGGTKRWSVYGTDLGLTSQSLGATFSDQGLWKLGFDYDELRHNLSDTYQTPYVGSMGGNSFTLPSGFGVVASASSTQPGTNALSNPQLAAFHNMDVSTYRKNTSLNGELLISSRWSADFDIRHLDQTGAKLTGVGLAGWGATAATGGSPARTALAVTTGEIPTILPVPTNYTTDTLRVGLNWKGEQSHLSAAYTGSFFRDRYDRMTFDTWYIANMTQTLGTAPDSDAHQLSFSGGYAFTPKTKLAGNFSIGRNIQNANFVYDAFMMQPAPGVLAANSANGLVATKHMDLKVTDESYKDWVLAAGVKQDLRNNKSDSNIYSFYGIGGQQTSYPNAPRSWDKTLYEVSGDYRFANDRHVKVDLSHENMNRWCNQYASGGLVPPAPAYAAGTNCVVATSQNEDKLGATYRAKAGEDIDYRVGYSVAKRVQNADPNARTPFLAGNGGAPGLNGGDFPGFYPAFDADRIQQILKANVNWQASEKLGLGANGRWTSDRYNDSTYGEQQGYSWSLNLDANYAYSETLSFTSYLTRQQRQRGMTDLQATAAVTPTATALSRPANATWSDSLMEDDVMFGFGVKQRGLMGGKLELGADLTYAYTDISYNTTLNYVAQTNPATYTCASPQFYTCGDLPNITSELTQLKLSGSYQVDKSSKVLVRYVYQMLNAADYYYNGYQYGATPNTLLPTNQQPGAYSVNLVTVAYQYNF